MTELECFEAGVKLALSNPALEALASGLLGVGVGATGGILFTRNPEKALRNTAIGATVGGLVGAVGGYSQAKAVSKALAHLERLGVKGLSPALGRSRLELLQRQIEAVEKARVQRAIMEYQAKLRKSPPFDVIEGGGETLRRKKPASLRLWNPEKSPKG